MESTIIFRVDGGGEIGFGHIIRSLAIASSLRAGHPSVTPLFVSIPNEAVREEIASRGFDGVTLPPDRNEIDFLSELISTTKAPVLFIDSTRKYLREDIVRLKQNTKVILFHNSSEGISEADMVIIPSGHTDSRMIEGYRDCSTVFIGPEYVVLGNHALALHDRHEYKKNTIGITTGASDPRKVMLELLRMMQCEQLKKYRITAYIGKDFIHREALAGFMRDNAFENIVAEPYDLGKIIQNELLISTFGVSTYELMFLGKPVVSVGHCEMNANGSRLLAERFDCIEDLGLIDNLDQDKLRNKIIHLFSDEKRMATLRDNAGRVVDGHGVDRIVNLISRYL